MKRLGRLSVLISLFLGLSLFASSPSAVPLPLVPSRVAAEAMPQIAADLTVTPGTLLAIDATTRTLVLYSTTGSVLSTLPIVGTMDNPIGVVVIGGNIWVADVDGLVMQIHPTTGAIVTSFNAPPSYEGLATNGTDLLLYNHNVGGVSRYSTGGALLGTVAIPCGGTGLDYHNGNYYLGGYSTDGDIRVFNSAGALLTTIDTAIPAGSIGGLAYDPATNTFWVATGFGDDRVYQISAAGGTLGSFASGQTWLNGLYFTPAAVAVPQVPTAGTTALLVMLSLIATIAVLRLRF